jgi:mono/diheme cytochrome c family protein
VYRAVVLPALLLSLAAVCTQQPSSNPTTQKTPSYEGIPLSAAKQANPVAATPDSLARAKRWWTMDCEMCHGKNGDGKGETAKEMKLTMVDFTNSDTLKDRTDGEIFYIIKNGHNDMPAEGERVKNDETWDLVNYVRSLAKKNADAKGQ